MNRRSCKSWFSRVTLKDSEGEGSKEDKLESGMSQLVNGSCGHQVETSTGSEWAVYNLQKPNKKQKES